jgi:hypothetical protein
MVCIALGIAREGRVQLSTVSTEANLKTFVFIGTLFLGNYSSGGINSAVELIPHRNQFLDL